ncbi:hypothetical protein RIVM261_076530 [Rivularia sp. IAM M-261]|nr:hypothetical protein RIVM261_076530 [Rivularia sp. IAM M-261]
MVTSQQLSFPCLWVAGLANTMRLRGRFLVADLFAKPENIDLGIHLILVDSKTPEELVRRAGYLIKAAGCHPLVYSSQQSLEVLFSHEAFNDKELITHLFEFNQDFDDWVESLNNQKISTKEAEKIAAVVIKYASYPLSELQDLRKRCGASSYEWKEIVDKLRSIIKSEDIATEVKAVSLRDRVIEIINSQNNRSERKIALIELAKSSGAHIRELEELAEIIEQEFELSETKHESASEIDKLLNLSQTELSLHNYLPRNLAEPLTQWCNWLSIRPEVALTAVLCAASSLHKVGTELVIHRGQNFTVPPTIYSALVSESGQRKSPVFRTLIRQPLGVLHSEARQKYQRELAQYEANYAVWKEDPQGEAPPVKPAQEIYFFTDATGEGIKAQASFVPEKSLLALIDELAGLFNSANKYRNGRGSDRQDMLSYFDGLGPTVLRASGAKVDVDQLYLSIFGTIQPGVLKQHLEDCTDPDGQWSRILFVNQPLQVATLSDDDSDINISELLAGCYRRIDALPLTEYTLSKEAFKCYQKTYDQLERLRVSHPNPGMRAVFSKMEGYIGRLAINLHVINYEATGNTPPNEISLATILKAIELVKFYIAQIKLIHLNSAADTGEPTAVLTKLINEVQRCGKLTVREATRSCFSNRIKSVEVIAYFRELEAMGYGRIEKNRNSIAFIASVSNITTVKPTDVSKNKNAESNVNKQLESNQSNGVITVNTHNSSTEISQSEKRAGNEDKSDNNVNKYSDEIADSSAQTPDNQGLETVINPHDNQIDTSITADNEGAPSSNNASYTEPNNYDSDSLGQ